MIVYLFIIDFLENEDFTNTFENLSFNFSASPTLKIGKMSF